MKRSLIFIFSIILLFSSSTEASVIKGILYQPEYPLNRKNIQRDILLLKEAGANIIISDVPITDKEILDLIHQSQLKIIMVFPYYHKTLPCLINKSYLSFIEEYKSHPAISMWSVGLALNYDPYANAGNISAWYNKANEYSLSIKLKDPLHSVTVINGGLPPVDVVSSCTSVDIWGLLVFNGCNLSGTMKQWDEKYEKLMFVVSGIDSYDQTTQKENEKMQAFELNQLLCSVYNQSSSHCKGFVLLSLNDNAKLIGSSARDTKGIISPVVKFGGDGISDIEYFGIVKNNRKKKRSYKLVKHFFEGLNREL